MTNDMTDDMTNAEVFRPRSSFLFAGVMIIGSLLLTAQTILYPNGEDRIASVLWAIAICVVSYWLFIHPKVVLFDEGITIRNPINEITVGWGDIDEIDVQYTLNIRVAGKKIHAWAAPAPGRYHSRTIHPSELRGMRLSGNLLRPGESPRTDSGQAAQLARARHESFVKDPKARIDATISNPTALLIVVGISLFLAIIQSLFRTL